MNAIERSESTTGDKVKEKKVSYHISIEKFNFACDLFQVKPEDKKEALKWAAIVANAATEAPEVVIREARRRRGWSV